MPGGAGGDFQKDSSQLSEESHPTPSPFPSLQKWTALLGQSHQKRVGVGECTNPRTSSRPGTSDVGSKHPGMEGPEGEEQ